MTSSYVNTDYTVRRQDDKSAHPSAHAGGGPLADFLQLLARATRQFHTYPPTSPLCTDAVGLVHKAFTALALDCPLTIRVGKRELVVDDEQIGRGTVIEQELWRPLHRARVASVELEPAVSIRDWTHFCPVLAAGIRPSRRSPSFPELLLEAGVSAIIVRVTPRPELFELGAPAEPVRALVERERTHQQSMSVTGAAKHLYPPDKGWVRLDPSVDYESISLLDLAVIVNEPAELAVMLTKLIDEDATDESARAKALQHRYADVVMLVGALDTRLGRILFSKLARAVLELDADRRKALLQSAILPGLLDGRLHGEAVLREFPDLELADALCLLLDLDAASADVLPLAVDRLHLTEERRTSLAPLIQQKLREGRSRAAEGDRWSAAGFDRVAASLTRIGPEAGKDFAEFAAFDLAITDETATALTSIRETVLGTEAHEAQIGCALNLARVEPNPMIVAAMIGRAVLPLSTLERRQRWHAVANLIVQLDASAAALEPTRNEVAHALRDQIVTLCDRDFTLQLAQVCTTDRQLAGSLVRAAGRCIVPSWLELFETVADRPSARQLTPLMADCASSIAPAIADRLPQLGVDAACAALTVLACAGPGFEDAIAQQTEAGDERRGREAMRALARVASTRAAMLIVNQIEHGPLAVRPAAEEALWRLPASTALTMTQGLLERRDFVTRHPDTASRLLDRSVQCAGGGLDPLLRSLMPLRFHFWRPAVARIGARARALRG